MTLFTHGGTNRYIKNVAFLHAVCYSGIDDINGNGKGRHQDG